MGETNKKHVEEHIEEPVNVIFRKYSDGAIIALFPDLYCDDAHRFCESYMHVGQHSGASYVHVLALTKRATPAEYQELKEELERAGYVLVMRPSRARKS
jgi:hypothetical protein